MVDIPVSFDNLFQRGDTCNLSGVNAFEYLTILEKHSADVFKHPYRWLPWNYKQQLEAAKRD